MREFDVIVVGGGIAGLIAAAFASKGGARALLLEEAHEFGGRARTRSVAGYHFNQGAHAFYRDGFLDNALRDLGVPVAGSVPNLASGFFVSENTLHQAPFGAAGLAGTTLLSDLEKSEMAAIFRRLRDSSVEAPPETCLEDALAALSTSPKVRSVVAAMTRLTSLVHAPKAADGSALLDQLQGGLARNAIYLDYGWGTIVDGLRSACAELGVQLRSSARVASIEHRLGWRVTLSDGTAETAPAVVLAIDPAQAAALFPKLASLDGATSPLPARVACLDLGLARLPRPENVFALGVDRPLYISVHSAAARLAPDGGALVHVVRYLEPGEKPSRGELIAELEGFMDLTQPGWRACEQARQFLPAMPAISSIPLASRGGMNGRPRVAAPDAEGLYICGDWVGPVGMLADAAAASGGAAGKAAAVSARAIRRRHSARREAGPQAGAV